MQTELKPRRKYIQIVIVLVIVAVLTAVFFFIGLPLIDELTPSNKRVSLYEYLDLPGDEQAVFMVGEYRSPLNLLVRDGTVYWDYENIRRNFVDSFWLNMGEEALFLTTADEVIRADAGERFYIRHAEAAPGAGIEPEIIRVDAPVFFIEKNIAYISLDYTKLFSNFIYEVFTGPYRVQLHAYDASYEAIDVIKNTALRTDTDIKSDIVCDLGAGETVFVLERLESWSKVQTEDTLIGFVENRRLAAESFSMEITVPQDYEAPPFTGLTEDRRICIAWHQVTVAEANAYLSDVTETAWPLDVISPTWYSIADGSGAVKSIAWKSYVEEAHARGYKVWPLVDDFTTGLDRETLLLSTESRNNFVSYIISQADELGFDGINLDFEVVPEEAADGFEQLIRELSVACRAHRLVFSIDNYPPRPQTEHYNRELQGQVADYVIIMGYDEHWGTSSGVGSVASLPFVIDAIEQTLDAVPAYKTINAVPFYTRVWTTAKDGTISATAIGQQSQAEWVERRGLEPVWDELLGQYYTEIEENNTLRQVWLEESTSMQARMDAMKKYELGGVACWRLGLENVIIWDILGEYTRGRV